MTDQQQPTDPATSTSPSATDRVTVGPWRTNHVQPGTGYADAPEEHVPPGWYVVRGPAEPDPEVPCDAFGSIHVQNAIDQFSKDDIAADVAAAIAALLNDAAAAHADQRRHDQQQAVLFGGSQGGLA